MKWLQSLFSFEDDTQTLLAESGFLPHLCNSMAVLSLVIAGELIAVALVLASSALDSFSWWHLGLVSLTVQWIVIMSTFILCHLSKSLSGLSVRSAGAVAYTVVLLVSLLVLAAAQWCVAREVDVLLLIKHMLLSAIFSGIILRFLYLQQQLRYQQQAELSSRIQALHARIRPHFLFNSMNAVASLIPVNPERAEKVIEDLSQLFRVSLREHSLVSLAEEISLCRRYIDIEQVRLGDRLKFVWMLDESADDLVVPSLLLQPLLENAVYHGIQRIAEGGTIRFESWKEDAALLIRVINPIPSLPDNQMDELAAFKKPQQKMKNNRMAVKNIEHRLQAHYGKSASIVSEDVEKVERGKPCTVYQVTVTIPVKCSNAK